MVNISYNTSKLLAVERERESQVLVLLKFYNSSSNVNHFNFAVCYPVLKEILAGSWKCGRAY